MENRREEDDIIVYVKHSLVAEEVLQEADELLSDIANMDGDEMRCEDDEIHESNPFDMDLASVSGVNITDDSDTDGEIDVCRDDDGRSDYGSDTETDDGSASQESYVNELIVDKGTPLYLNALFSLKNSKILNFRL